MVGFQAIAGDFAAIDKATNEVIVPHTLSNSYGVFAVESFNIGAFANQLGVRVEDTTLDPQGLSSLNYVPVRASASSVWKINDSNSLNLAITRSQRAPQVQELLTNGFHDAPPAALKSAISICAKKPPTTWIWVINSNRTGSEPSLIYSIIGRAIIFTSSVMANS